MLKDEYIVYLCLYLNISCVCKNNTVTCLKFGQQFYWINTLIMKLGPGVLCQLCIKNKKITFSSDDAELDAVLMSIIEDNIPMKVLLILHLFLETKRPSLPQVWCLVLVLCGFNVGEEHTFISFRKDNYGVPFSKF